MKRIKDLVCRVVAGVAMLFALMPQAWAEDALKVAVARHGVWESALAELGQQAGVFKKHGIVLDLFYLEGSSETRQSVVSNRADIGLAVDAMAAMHDYAFGAPIRIIAASMAGSANYWFVLKSSPIQTLNEVAGKTIAYEANGLSSHYDALDFLKQFRLKAKLVVTGRADATFAQLKSGRVDLAWAAAPFGIDEVEQGNLRVIARANDIRLTRNKTTRVMITNADTLQKRKDVLIRFLQAYRETVEWMYSDPAALNRYAEFAGVSEGVARRLRDEFYTKDMLSPDKIVSVRTIVRDAVAQRYLSKRLSRKQLRDLVQIAAPASGDQVGCEFASAACPIGLTP